MAAKRNRRPVPAPDLAWLFSDLPADAEALRFEFEPLAKTLAELALNPDNQTPFTVVVRGSWGRGKTTLLKRAQRMVRKPELVTDATGLRRVETLWFNAWKYPDEDTVLAGLLGALLDKLHRGGWKEQLKKLVLGYSGSVLAAALRAAAPPTLKELVEVESRFSPAEERRAFHDTFRELFGQVAWVLFHDEGVLQDLKGRGVEKLWTKDKQREAVLAVFLDDLDRCSRKRVVEVLQAVNLFLDLPGVCFFLGIDGDRLQRVLPDAVRDEAEEFLEKMIQVAFDLPEVAEEDAEGYIEALVRETPLQPLLEAAPSGVAAGADRPAGSTGDGKSDAWVIARALKRRHPRHVKRFLNDLSMGLAVMRTAGRLGDASPALPAAAVIAWHLLSETLPAEKWVELRTQPKLLRVFLGEWQELAEKGSGEDGEAGEGEVMARLQRAGLLDRHIAVLAGLDDAQVSALHLATPPTVEARRRRAVSGGRLLDPASDAWRQLDGGEFGMGADISAREKPIHPVRLSRYAISRYPVTNAEYLPFVRESELAPPRHWEGGEIPEGRERHPVVNVSWADAEAFCAWATTKLGGKGAVRLPTEAQWEFAARGAEGRKYPWGEEDPDKRRANFGNDVGGTTPVGSYPDGATPQGLHDLAGNVWEWCWDRFGPYPQPDQVQVDPTGPSEGSSRVLRGGAFYFAPRDLRGAYRNDARPGRRGENTGFRVVWSSSGGLES